MCMANKMKSKEIKESAAHTRTWKGKKRVTWARARREVREANMWANNLTVRIFLEKLTVLN